MLYKLIDSLYYLINNNITFKVKLLDVLSKPPSKSESGSAGYDIFSIDNCVIEKGKRKLINTGISLQVPNYYYLRVAPRSGLSCKGIDIGAGVIDSSYRGPLKVLVINNSDSDYNICIGDKISQIIMERCGNANIEITDELSESVRGSDGFGSTGN
jgi:dUTP pyrophosphatase